MSEYWKSTPKYWCKHCSAYVKDTPFERKQHESTGKHQGNLKRFLRDIQNSHERGEREKDRAQAEVERLKGVAGAAAGTSPSSPLAPGARSAKPAAAAPVSVADRKKQWAQLANMGIQVPEGFRSEMAMAGDWQTMARQPAPEEASLSTGIRKRKYEGQEDDEEEEKAVLGESSRRRGWGSTTKTYPGRDTVDDLDDLLSGSIAVKKEENQSLQPRQPVQVLATDAGRDSSAAPSLAGDLSNDDKVNPIKQETIHTESSHSVASTAVDEALPMPVFKKRKGKGS